MPVIYKVKEHSPTEDAFIYQQTSADIVDFDPTNIDGVEDTTVQNVIETLNDKIEDRVTHLKLSETIDSINEVISRVDGKVDGSASTITLRATIMAEMFEGTVAPYTQRIYIDGVYATDNPIIGLIESDSLISAMEQKDSWGCVSRIKCEDGFITVYCYESKPSVDIDIQIKIIR